MKNSWLLLPTLVLLFLWNFAFAQNPPKILCPATPSYAFFDSLCFIPSGTLILPQGYVDNLFGPSQGANAYIPSNHFGWAISMAHAWNYTRNVLRTPNKLSMELWMSIGVVETQLGCIPGATWSPGSRASATQGLATGIYNQDGCFQMENSGAWNSFAGEIRQIYPTRFVNAEPRMYFNYTLERASLSMGYEWVMKMVRARYKYGVDPYAIAVGAADPLSYNKVLADFHNAQMWSFLGGQMSYLYTNRVALQSNANWPDFGTLGDGLYVTKNGKVLSTLQQRTTHGNYPGGTSNFNSNYNASIPWDTVALYLTTIKPFYHEYSVAAWTTLTNKVKAKFVSISGSVTTPIAFQQLGPVVDQIILGLPKEDPTMPSLPNQSILANWDNKHACWGDIVPVGHISVPAGKTTVCLGTSYTLNGIVDGGESSDISFKWFRNGSSTPFATTRNVTESPATAGTYIYSFQTCNTKGCMPATCDITMTVTNCGGCGMSVTATTVNTPCQNMKAGTINLNVTGSTHYTVNFTGPVSGSITSTTAASSITGLPDGLYNIEIVDFTTPACKAYTNATVLFTTAQNAQLDAKITSATSCLANVQAKVVENPAPCLWTVNFYEPTYFGWSPAVYAVISPGTNTPGMYQADIQNPAVSWQEVRGKLQFYASTGDQIKIDLSVSPTPGASNLRPIYFEIVNSSNVVVWSGTAPANMVSETAGVINAHLTTYTVNCPFTPPSYNFTWSPTLSTVTNTTNTSTGTIDISFTSPRLYTVTAQNATNSQCTLTDTIWIQPTCPTALPVQFVSFDATLVAANEIKLEWVTAFEKEASYFQAERSLDGIHFTALGTITAVGNSSSLNAYQYIDHYLPRGIVYYRIAEYDVNGAKMYTSIKSIEGLKNFHTSVYPNPSVSSFTVYTEGEGDSNVSLVVYDILGNELEHKTTSINKIEIVGEHLVPGAYILHIKKSDEAVIVHRLVKE